MGDRNWGYSPTSSIEYDKCLDNKEVENNPEFWEEIIEKDYEIIQFVCTEKRGKEKVGTRLTKQPNGSFWISPEFTEEKMLTLNHYSIYSIKRLSDGEIFTIGDTVDYIHKSYYSPWKIDNFFIKKNTLLARSESSLICEYIKDLKHIKTPIFVTEDNISKYFNDSYYYIVENDRAIIPYAWEVLANTVTWQNPLKVPLGKIQFHNLEKAKQYIEENKPIYSKKDMLNFGKYVGAVLNFTNPEKLLIDWNLNHKNEWKNLEIR